jgi:cell division protein FtsB
VNRNLDTHDPAPTDDPDTPEQGGGKWRFRPFGWVKGPSRAIALALLVVLVVLFGRDVLSSWYLRGEISRLRELRQELLDSLAADSLLLRRLEDPDFLERYARERYLMRRPGETVYILSDE